MYPLPVASVHVVPEVGADARLNTNPEVTIVGLDPLEGVILGVGVLLGVVLGVLVMLGVGEKEGVFEGVVV